MTEKIYRVTVSAVLPYGVYTEETYHVSAGWSWKAMKEAVSDFNYTMMCVKLIDDYEILNVSAREEEECDEE